MTLTLELLRHKLSKAPGFEEDAGDIERLQRSVYETVTGMERLLQAEALRHRAARPEYAPVDLRALLVELGQEWSLRAREKGLELAVSVPEKAEAKTDRQLVKLALQNLLGNAIKYTARGRVKLDASRSETDWALTVSDTGPGIESDRLGNLFKAFERGATHGQAGVGLGLAIASQAADAVGAKLTAESQMGVGSTFRLNIPAHIG